jgi:CheY-like chemotaxis protein
MEATMKIMVVDDEQDMQVLFRQRFRKEIKTSAVKFHFAVSAESALEYLKNNDITDLYLILSDINMPGMNGIELLREVKENYPNLPVYMITAYSDENNKMIAQKYGCDDYLTKPLNFDNLKTKIFSTIIS